VQRLLELYRRTDVKLASAVDESIKLGAIEHAGDTARKPAVCAPRKCAGTSPKPQAPPQSFSPSRMDHGSARSHSTAEIPTTTRASRRGLSQLLDALDGALAVIETNMGPVWREAVVVLVTEFGHTARIRLDRW
jgi:uncharacterized protein (DUF1501 family)